MDAHAGGLCLPRRRQRWAALAHWLSPRDRRGRTRLSVALLVLAVLCPWSMAAGVRTLYARGGSGSGGSAATAALRARAGAWTAVGWNAVADGGVRALRRLAWWRGSCLPSTCGLDARGASPARLAAACSARVAHGVELVTGAPVSRAHDALTFARLRQYAQQHAYPLEDASARLSLLAAQLPPGAREHWAKVRLMRERVAASNASFVMWLDSDVVVANVAVRVEQLVYDVADDTSVEAVLTVDDGGLNSGVFLVRAGPAGVRFLDEWLSFLARPEHTFDQSALRELFHARRARLQPPPPPPLPPLGADSGAASTPLGRSAPGLVVLRQCAMNSTPLVSWQQDTYMHGDFLVHFYGLFSRASPCITAWLRDGREPGLECT